MFRASSETDSLTKHSLKKKMGYITDSEIDGKVSPHLIDVFNLFIRALRSVFYIHCFTKGKHSANSYHYKGLAGDGHKGEFRKERETTFADEYVIMDNLRELLRKEKKTIFEQAILARLVGFKGIGIYPNWKPKAGLHLDLRENNLFWIGLNKEKLLKKIKNSKKETIYIYLK